VRPEAAHRVRLDHRRVHLDVHIARLRLKLEDNPANPRHIQTVRGVGYRFSP
jgi:DNA-binding response OmpR family regulator